MADTPSDVARMAALAKLVRDEGMRVSAIVAGDIRLVFAEPWPVREQMPARTQAEEVHKDEGAVDQELAELRKRSKQQFGRVLPDDQLLNLRGVL